SCADQRPVESGRFGHSRTAAVDRPVGLPVRRRCELSCVLAGGRSGGDDTLPVRGSTSRRGSHMALTLTVNGQAHSIDVDPDSPLLWAIRDAIGLTGTKFGCGIAECGACTVLVNGRAVRSCMFPVSSAEGAAITTIEGLAKNGALN